MDGNDQEAPPQGLGAPEPSNDDPITSRLKQLRSAVEEIPSVPPPLKRHHLSPAPQVPVITGRLFPNSPVFTNSLAFSGVQGVALLRARADALASPSPAPFQKLMPVCHPLLLILILTEILG